ncbi:hypothetical protein L1987_48014 [Smallanthus sonchifolius]|uniref:Uncharacterized protein n=1 Tax=Smallanthus sonchifolius TaxID=185202 RepID=A0ACB9FQ59_9ASTR|nr:hypothetical protein L1987_48014 [Smallanthus sonchifolius]
MTTMKFALVSFTIFVLLEAYNARQLHGVSIKGSVDGRPPSHVVVIQMVTGEEKLRLPQSPPLSSSRDETTYGRVNLPPPPSKVGPSKGQATYGRVNPSPPPPYVAPSKGQETYGRVNPSPPPPYVAPSKGHETYGRVNPSPPPPYVAPSGRQTIYGEGIDGRRNLSPPQAPAFISNVKTESNEDWWHSVASLSSCVTRVFKY